MRARIKQTKASSAVGFLVGIVFVFIGLTVVLPHAGAFGVFWTLGALVITVCHGINLFTDKGIAQGVVEFDNLPSESSTTIPPLRTIEQRLGDLESLYRRGQITPQEYEEQRTRILESL